ncbi:MAG: glycosyltransferase, partial [Povalibacter sp.]
EIEAALIRKLGSNIPIVRIPNGIDLSRWSSSGEPRDSIRQRLELPQGLLITYCGRLSRAKGLPRLLQVWSRLAPRHIHAHLVLVGGGDRSPDNCESELRDIVRSSGLETRVSFIGQVEDVTDYLRASDVFVLPSDSEGFGLSLIEAMAVGLPSVSTAVGVAPEVITDGETGWLVPPRDATALENAIETALNSRERWASIGRLGQRQVEKFEMTEVAREYETLIERTCSFAGASLTSKSRVRANASWLLGCRITADLLNFVLFVIVTNLFGPAGMGVYAYGFAIAGFVYAATTLGIDEYGIREYVRRSGDERNQLISELLGAQVLVGLAAFAALAIYLYVTAATSDVLVIVASLSVYQLCAALSNTMFVPSMAEQRMMRPALTVLVSRAAALGAAGLLMWLAHAALMWALVPFAISGVFMLVLAATSARSEGARLHPQISRSVLHDAGRNLWSFATIDIMGQLFTRIGVIGLMLWANEHAAGIYAAGLKLAEVACMPLLFLGQAAYPTLSRAYTRPREFRSLSRQALLWGSLIAIVIAVAMALLVPVLLVPLLGQGYAGSEPIIAAMSALALMQGWEIVIGRLLLAANLSIARAKWVSIGAVICALSTALLTPKFGVTAAVIATVSSYAIVDALYLRSLLQTLRRNSHAEHETTLAEPAQRKVAA